MKLLENPRNVKQEIPQYFGKLTILVAINSSDDAPLFAAKYYSNKYSCKAPFVNLTKLDTD